MQSVLTLRRFGVAFSERIILAEINLEIPERGPLLLVGPMGSGKSTLLRTVCGLNEAHPEMQTWGELLYRGRPLTAESRPALVAQNARQLLSTVLDNLASNLPGRSQLKRPELHAWAAEFLEARGQFELRARLHDCAVDLPIALQRRLAILRTCAADPGILCVDEPTSELALEDSLGIVQLLQQESQQRALMIVTHQQEHALMLGGLTALMAGGRIQECLPTAEFFSRPQTKPGRDFVRTGGCVVPSPNAKPEDLDESASLPPPLPEAIQALSAFAGPRGFTWLKPGRLAGTPQPGLLTDLDLDLEALRRVGVTVLVSLTETPLAIDHLDQRGIRGLSLPIPDMGAPSMEDAAELCRQVAGLLEAGEVVALHCKAGQGRTGTMLAAQLIWEGQSALEAVERARSLEPRWIQSVVQAQFLEGFDDYCRALVAPRA